MIREATRDATGSNGDVLSVWDVSVLGSRQAGRQAGDAAIFRRPFVKARRRRKVGAEEGQASDEAFGDDGLRAVFWRLGVKVRPAVAAVSLGGRDRHWPRQGSRQMAGATRASESETRTSVADGVSIHACMDCVWNMVGGSMHIPYGRIGIHTVWIMEDEAGKCQRRRAKARSEARGWLRR